MASSEALPLRSALPDFLPFRGPSGSTSTRASVEPPSTTTAPDRARQCDTVSTSARSPSTTVIRHSRQSSVAPGPAIRSARTRSSLNPASNAPSWPTTRCSRRRVLTRTIGTSERSRTKARTGAITASGTSASLSPSGRCGSAPMSLLSERSTYQPASTPPVRRCSPTPRRASARSGVSKYTVSRRRSSGGLTQTTPSTPTRTGSMASGLTSNVRPASETSVSPMVHCPSGDRAP